MQREKVVAISQGTRQEWEQLLRRQQKCTFIHADEKKVDRNTAPLIHNHCTRRQPMVYFMSNPLYPPENNRYVLNLGLGGTQGRSVYIYTFFLKRKISLTPTRIRNGDREAHSPPTDHHGCSLTRKVRWKFNGKSAHLLNTLLFCCLHHSGYASYLYYRTIHRRQRLTPYARQ